MPDSDEKNYDGQQRFRDTVIEMKKDLKYVLDDVRDIKGRLEEKYVTNAEYEALVRDFILLRNIVYGMIGFITLTVIGALVAGVVQ